MLNRFREVEVSGKTSVVRVAGDPNELVDPDSFAKIIAVYKAMDLKPAINDCAPD